jgi:hypothetical protein
MFYWLLPTRPTGRGDGLQFWLRAGWKEEDPEELEAERRLRQQLEVRREPCLQGFCNVLAESLQELGTDFCGMCAVVNDVRADLFARTFRIVTGAPPPTVQHPAPAEWTTTPSEEAPQEVY